MLHRESGQPYGRRHQLLYTVDDEKRASMKQNNWIDDQLALSDESENDEANLFAFNNYLVPHRQQISWAKVVKFYWFWFVLCISHYFVFFTRISLYI